jgi:hypothetical protein
MLVQYVHLKLEYQGSVGHSYKVVVSNMDVMINAAGKCKNNFNYFFTGYIIIIYPCLVVNKC